MAASKKPAGGTGRKPRGPMGYGTTVNVGGTRYGVEIKAGKANSKIVGTSARTGGKSEPSSNSGKAKARQQALTQASKNKASGVSNYRKVSKGSGDGMGYSVYAKKKKK